MRQFGLMTVVVFSLLWGSAAVLMSLARRQSVQGNWLVYIAPDSGGQDEIFRMWWDGSAVRQLTDFEQGRRMQAAASFDGEWIYFVSDHEGDDDLYRMSFLGGEAQRVTQNTGFDGQPAVSGDSKYLVFFSDRPAGNGLYWMPTVDIETVDRASPYRITALPGYAWSPSWSPDGEWIAFQSDYEDNFEIYRIRYDGTDIQRLTRHPAYDAAPAWSPDGEWIAFVSTRGDKGYQIYRMRPDGSGMTLLTPPPRTGEIEYHDPKWSPDNEWITFWSRRQQNQYVIYRMRADGGDLTAVTKPGSALAPTWMPFIELPWTGTRVIVAGLVSLGLALFGLWADSKSWYSVRFSRT